MRTRALGALAAGALIAVAAWATAQPLDPTLPHERVVGPSAAPAAMIRLDPERSGRTTSPLPRAPHVLWRARAQGGIEHAVSVDAHGAIVIASSIAQVVQLDAHGKPAWTVRTGHGAPLATPVITSDGTRVVVVPGPRLVGIDRTGHVRFERALPAPATSSFVAAPLPLENGGVALALGHRVLRVGPAGRVVAMTDMPETVQALLGRGSSILAVTDRGNVLSWRGASAPSRIGSLGGEVDGWPALCSAHTLCASVNHHRLVGLDLDTGLRQVRFDDASVTLLGSPAVTRTHETVTVTADGLALGYSASGKETLRVGLIPGALAPDAGITPTLVRRTTLPPLIIDASGTLGFARPGLDAGVVTPAGDLHTAPGTACADPVGVFPAGPHRMVVACRSGLVWLVGDGPASVSRSGFEGSSKSRREKARRTALRARREQPANPASGRAL